MSFTFDAIKKAVDEANQLADFSTLSARAIIV